MGAVCCSESEEAIFAKVRKQRRQKQRQASKDRRSRAFFRDEHDIEMHDIVNPDLDTALESIRKSLAVPHRKEKTKKKRSTKLLQRKRQERIQNMDRLAKRDLQSSSGWTGVQRCGRRFTAQAILEDGFVLGSFDRMEDALLAMVMMKSTAQLAALEAEAYLKCKGKNVNQWPDTFWDNPIHCGRSAVNIPEPMVHTNTCGAAPITMERLCLETSNGPDSDSNEGRKSQDCLSVALSGLSKSWNRVLSKSVNRVLPTISSKLPGKSQISAACWTFPLKGPHQEINPEVQRVLPICVHYIHSAVI